MIAPLLFGQLLGMRFSFGYVFRVGISNAGMRESVGAARQPGKRWEKRKRCEGSVQEPEAWRLWPRGLFPSAVSPGVSKGKGRPSWNRMSIRGGS